MKDQKLTLKPIQKRKKSFNHLNTLNIKKDDEEKTFFEKILSAGKLDTNPLEMINNDKKKTSMFIVKEDNNDFKFKEFLFNKKSIFRYFYNFVN
jgi:hypothetical protein